MCARNSLVGLPDTMLVLTPSNPSNSQSATFTFSGSDKRHRGLDFVQSATLRADAASSTSGRTLQALRINAAWNEMQVTRHNQPATTGAAATTTSGNGYRQWNVLSQVQAMYDLNASTAS